jgi:hypothetical protein
MAKTTFWDIIERTIERVATPLSAKEIWDKANELGTIGDYETTGKTPWATIAAYCYTDINRGGETSMIIQTSERPALFYLRKLGKPKERAADKESKVIEKKAEEKKKSGLAERDLHEILTAFAISDTHFSAHLKTVFHEKSTPTTKGLDKWMHPDLVGVYFPFGKYEKTTIEIQKELSVSSVRLFSFELKLNIGFSNFKESYFQAVSNSSWAHEDYLVTLDLDGDPTLMDDLRRLNNAFGIGLIKIELENIYESSIIFPARVKSEIDWDTANRLAKQNKDFSDFLNSVSEDCSVKKIKSVYDKVYSIEELNTRIKEKTKNDAL